MPVMLEEPERRLEVQVGHSAAVELFWILTAAGHPEYRKQQPALADLYRARPDLRVRVEKFWGPDKELSCPGFFELTVIADHGQALMGVDADVLLPQLDRLCANSPADLPLASETEDDRAVVEARLALLRSSRAARRKYVQLITDVWEAVEPIWAAGRATVERSVSDRRRMVAAGAPWRDVIGPGADFDGLVERLVDALPSGGRLKVVPALFTQKAVLADLEGAVLVGVRSAGDSLTRQRSLSLARRLKALSDPTRLAILRVLLETPRTVGELSTSFGLAQPTVSNHLKLLRDAGLVSTVSTAGRKEQRVSATVVEELLDELGGFLQSPDRPDAAAS